MKKTSLVVLGFLLLAAPPAVQAQSFLTNGLVAYYPFNGNANDASGNGNNGTVIGATLTQDQFGIPDSAYSFDGVSNFITIPDFPQADANAHTISAWIQANSWFNIPNPSADYVDILGKDGWETGPRQWVFQGTQTGQFRSALFTSTGEHSFNSIAQLQTNQWYQLVQVWDGTNESIFINGEFDSSIPAPGTLVQGSEPVRIGGNPVDNQQFFDGTIDDVRIYNRALSRSEVHQLYGFEAPCLPHRATATATMVDGFVVAATITDGGCGYMNTPTVLIQGGGGTGAAATAVVSNGVVVNIIITDAGIDYTNTPYIYVYSPLGLQIGLIKAVKPTFSDLIIGTNYQLQVSGGLLNTWTNQGSPFTATNPVMAYPGYFDVCDWNQLFFRLQASP